MPLPLLPGSRAWPGGSSGGGSAGGVDFVDDYAHLPTEVACALKAASEGGWNRVVCVFQPHRYTRTCTCGRHSPVASKPPMR